MKEPLKTGDKKILGLFRPKFGSRAIYDESSASKAVKTAREGVLEIDYSFIKIILVIVGVSVCAFLFGYSLFAWGIFPSLLAGIFFASVVTLLSLLLKATGLHFAAGLTSSIAMTAPLYFFGGMPLIPSVVLAGISAALLTEGIIYGKQELDNSLKVSFTKFPRRIIARAFIVVALAAAIFYGSLFKVEDLSSDWFIDGTIFFSSPIINSYIPGFTSEMKFNEFLGISAQRAFTKEDAANFILMPEAAKRKIIDQAVENSHRAFEEEFEINIDLGASFKEIFRKVITEKLVVPARTMNPEHILIIAVVIIFIFIRGILGFFGWLAMMLAFFIFQLLLVIKFAAIYPESRAREMTVLK